MSTLFWQGTATAVAQVHTGSIDTVDATPANNTFTVTIGGVAISTVGTTDVATTATALRAALNASTHVYFSGITWSGSAGNIIGTADNAGEPFIAALTKTGAGTGTVTNFAATTASSGPNDWSTAGNWSTGAVPINGDTVYLANSAVPIYWGLAQSAVTLAALHVLQDFTAALGLPAGSYRLAGAANSGADEYREDYLSIGATICQIGRSSGNTTPAGSGRLKIDLGTAASTVTIWNSASSATESSLQPIRLLAASASTVVNALKGIVGVASEVPGETATVGTINVSYTSVQNTDCYVTVGDGVTLTNWNQTGGTNALQVAATSLVVVGGILTTSGSGAYTTMRTDAGKITHYATGAVTTLQNNGGTVYYNGNGTITTLNAAGEVDFSRDPRAKTVSNANVYEGATVKDHGQVVTWSNGLIFKPGATLDNVNLDLGTDFTITPS